MKDFHIPSSYLTPTLRESLNLNEEGCYIIYGIFIYNNELGVNKLHKGNFSEVQLQLSTEETELGTENTAIYIVPVPEFIASEKDTDFAKYIQIHFIKKSEMKSDEEMMKDFISAFAEKLASVESEDSEFPEGSTNNSEEV